MCVLSRFVEGGVGGDRGAPPELRRGQAIGDRAAGRRAPSAERRYPEVSWYIFTANAAVYITPARFPQLVLACRRSRWNSFEDRAGDLLAQKAVARIGGAGQVGPTLATRLVAAGHRVRVVRRSNQPIGVAGVETLVWDAGNGDFARRATEGASAIYHCMNPSSYTAAAWEAEIPRVGKALVEAATAHQARLVVLANLYAYGPCEGRLSEQTPMRARGRKGLVRARWFGHLEEASRIRELRFTVGRAGEFCGESAHQSLVSPTTIRGMLEGKRPLVLGNPEKCHAFSYVGDVADALAALGTAESDVDGRVYHLPVHEISPRELFEKLGSTLSVSIAPPRIGRRTLRLASPFVPLMRELLETYYQWDRPFLVDDSRFRGRFPDVGVRLETALARTVRALQPSEDSPRAEGVPEPASS